MRVVEENPELEKRLQKIEDMFEELVEKLKKMSGGKTMFEGKKLG